MIFGKEEKGQMRWKLGNPSTAITQLVYFGSPKGLWWGERLLVYIFFNTFLSQNFQLCTLIWLQLMNSVFSFILAPSKNDTLTLHDAYFNLLLIVSLCTSSVGMKTLHWRGEEEAIELYLQCILYKFYSSTPLKTNDEKVRSFLITVIAKHNQMWKLFQSTCK